MTFNENYIYIAAGCRLIKVVNENWWIPVGMKDAMRVCSETKRALFAFLQQVRCKY